VGGGALTPHFWPTFLMISVEKYAFFIENRKCSSFFLGL